MAMSNRRVVVLSGVNLVEGGPLTVFREMVRAMSEHDPRWTVHALVHRKGLLGVPGVTEHVFEHVKSSWAKRLYFEWFEAARICRALQPEVWVSMHDISPRIDGPRQYVYCHNAAPFSEVPLRRDFKDWRHGMFRLFYGHLYRLNIHRNDAVVVQQDWLREIFRRRYAVQRVIVAHPTGVPVSARLAHHAARNEKPSIFLYPTLPRVFKNIELIGDAVRLLEADPRWRGEVIVTIDGSESAYARALVDRYRGLRSLRWIGRQPHDAMNQRYAECDALLFPSLLETWGLPLTEAKDRGLPIVTVDLPYAHETVGTCQAVQFVPPHDAGALARMLLGLHLGEVRFAEHSAAPLAAPYARGWPALARLMLEEPTECLSAAATSQDPIRTSAAS